MAFKSGFATILGRPNVGKSTLLNALAGDKIAITSSKPQTTRSTIKAIVTRDDCQIVFMDTPGIHKPRNMLGKYMVSVAESTINQVDVILFIADASSISPRTEDLYIIEQLKQINIPVFLLINKVDLVKKQNILPLIENYKELMEFKEYIPISALNGEGTSIIIEKIKELLPEGPKYFPDDILTDQPERMLAAELIREKALFLLSDEIPHGIGIDISSFKLRKGKDIIDIEATIFCEKDSHKGIIIGKDGKMLKKIGTYSREEMEKIFGTKVFLQLWVKVKPDWRNSATVLKNLGYTKD